MADSKRRSHQRLVQRIALEANSLATSTEADLRLRLDLFLPCPKHPKHPYLPEDQPPLVHGRTALQGTLTWTLPQLRQNMQRRDFSSSPRTVIGSPCFLTGVSARRLGVHLLAQPPAIDLNVFTAAAICACVMNAASSLQVLCT